MVGLVDAQALHIRPVQHAAADARHLLLVGQRDELDILGVAGRLDLLDDLGEGVADPRDHHRPALDAAQAVDPLLQRRQLEQRVQVQGHRLFHLALDAHRPRPWLERAGVLRRVALVGAELVEVVVAGGVLVGGLLVHGRVGGIELGRQLGIEPLGEGLAAGHLDQAGAGGAAHGELLDETAARLEHRARGDVGRQYQSIGTFDQHVHSKEKRCKVQTWSRQKSKPYTFLLRAGMTSRLHFGRPPHPARSYSLP